MINEMVGLTEKEATLKMRDIAERFGEKLSIRIEKRDDTKYELTTDHKPWRFNLTIEDGIVTNVRMG